MKTIKVEPDKIKLTQGTSTIQNRSAYYTGNHPHLINSMGKAYFDSGQNSWLYKPEAVHAEWYRVHQENLTFD